MLADLFVAQAPPPPTLMPVPTAPVTLPSFGMWNTTDEFLQLWNSSAIGTGVQYFIIAVLIGVGIFVLIHFIRQLGGGDDH